MFRGSPNSQFFIKHNEKPWVLPHHSLLVKKTSQFFFQLQKKKGKRMKIKSKSKLRAPINVSDLPQTMREIQKTHERSSCL